MCKNRAHLTCHHLLHLCLIYPRSMACHIISVTIVCFNGTCTEYKHTLQYILSCIFYNMQYSGVHPSPEVCYSCGQLIEDMVCIFTCMFAYVGLITQRVCVHHQVLQARGKSYHSACFRCAVCKQSLEDLPFTVGTDKKVYCIKDYHKVQAPCCAACNKPILPTEGCTESIRVVSLNKNYHAECYGCNVDFV
ncbi:LIM domain-containing protein 1 isoform X2 [Vanacampus margaritifer]